MNNNVTITLILKLADVIYENSFGIVDRDESIALAAKEIDYWFEAGKKYPLVYHNGIAWYGQQIAQQLIRNRIDSLCDDNKNK